MILVFWKLINLILGVKLAVDDFDVKQRRVISWFHSVINITLVFNKIKIWNEGDTGRANFAINNKQGILNQIILGLLQLSA